MSDENRRGAIYVHPSDMESLKNNNYSTKNSKDNIVTTTSKASNSSDKIRIKSRPSNKTSDEQERRSKSTPPSTGASRRESMAAGGRRGSTMGDGYYRKGTFLPEPGSGGKGPAKGRRGSSHPGEGAQNRRGSRLDDTSYQPQRRKKKSDEPEPALTKEQVEAFQEVFNLFDSNGGGTIDADELQLVLGSVDIHLPAKDIRDVLEGIDKDGSGEIDFEEFLQLMTNTEKFLETFAASHDEHHDDEDDAVLVGGRETVLFDALTKFMKTSALTQMDVLQRYFNTKYKRAQAPHVVMHYAAGARLIGLTEKQLVQHLDRLQASNEDSDYKSPYAEPLRIMLAPLLNVSKKKKRRKDESVEDIQEVRPRLTGKIRIRVHFKSEDEKLAKVEENKKEEKLVSQVTKKKKKIEWVPRLGWVQPNVKRVADRLPKMKITYTMDDLPAMRQKIQVATKEYDHDLAISRRRANNLLWKTLQCDRMKGTQLNNFKRVFDAYSDIGKLVVI